MAASLLSCPDSYLLGFVLTAPESANCSVSNRASRFYMSFTGYDLRLRMRFLFCQQAQARR